MKYNKKIRNLGRVCYEGNPDEIRYALCAIQINAEHKCAVATNGHSLAVIDISDLLEENEITFLIPANSLQAAEEISEEIFPETEIFIRNRDHKVVVSAKDTHRSVIFDEINGHFPLWEELFENTPNGTEMIIDVNLLLDLVKALNPDYTECETARARMIYSSANRQISVHYGDVTISAGLLMPCKKVDEEELVTTYWTPLFTEETEDSHA